MTLESAIEIAVQIGETQYTSERQLTLQHIWSEKYYLAVKQQEKEEQAKN